MSGKEESPLRGSTVTYMEFPSRKLGVWESSHDIFSWAEKLRLRWPPIHRHSA